MEYIEGKPLAGPRPLAQALDLAAQMAEALAEAHRHEVIHRDLKPANGLVTKSGVKLLDFGLAKSTRGDNEDTLTVLGAVMGTPLYMAPEQRLGKEADERSDIYAFGATLHELVTGKRAAEGLQKIEPPMLDDIVRRCMEEDPEKRWQSAADLVHQLRWIAASPGTAAQKSRRPWAWIAAAAVMTVVAGVLATQWLRQPAAPGESLYLSVITPEHTRFAGMGSSLSPDGRHLVFTGVREGRSLLFIRSLDDPQARGIEGSNDAMFPFWSPDSKSIAFFASGKLKRVEISGTPPRILCNAVISTAGGAWSATNEIVLGQG